MEVEFYEALIEVHVSPEKARALAHSMKQEFTEQMKEFATKGDLKVAVAELRTEMRTEFAAIRAEMATLRAELVTRIECGRADTIKWLIGSQVALAGLILAGMKYLQ